MGRMKSDERYDAKEAYDKKLPSSERMHYLENDIADRKGHSGSYSGNHPRYSSPTSMMGQGQMGQGQMGQGQMGQAQADLAYNPMEDIAGQGTEGINAAMMMKGNSPFLKVGDKDKKTDPNKKSKTKDDFDYTPSIPGSGVTGTMETRNLGYGTGRPTVFDGNWAVKKAGQRLNGGGTVLESNPVPGRRGQFTQKVRQLVARADKN